MRVDSPSTVSVKFLGTGINACRKRICDDLINTKKRIISLQSQRNDRGLKERNCVLQKHYDSLVEQLVNLNNNPKGK